MKTTSVIDWPRPQTNVHQNHTTKTAYVSDLASLTDTVAALDTK